tara:strand:- start:3786 stop:4232 length:447 start_codon:yes stop_codon:yes gene_type:complete
MKKEEHKHATWLISLAIVIILGGVVFNSAPGDTNSITGASVFGSIKNFLSGLIGRAHSICQECKHVGTEKEGYYCNEELIELKKCAAGFQKACFSCWDGSDTCEGERDGACIVITNWKEKGNQYCAGKASDSGKVGMRKIKPLYRCDR